MVNNKTYWTMENGDKIDVDTMTKRHLRNTLKMIINNANTKQKLCPHNIDTDEQENQEPFYNDWMWK